MAQHFPLPVVKHDKHSWGCLNYYGKKQVICAESFDIKDAKYSFIGGHRVRLYSVEGNVHWRIPVDVEIDITDVKAANVPQRRQGRNR